MHTKTLAKKTIALFIWSAAFAAISVGSVYATWQTYSSTISTTGVGQTGTYCSTDGTLFAENGDVVTTDKWNQLSCHLRNMWYELTDGMRGKTNFIYGHNDTSTNPAGYVVDNINLPTTRPNENYGLGGSVMFKDPTQGYSTTSGWKGGMYWRDSDQSIVFFSQGGIRISGSPDIASSYMTLGWEKVNLLDDTLWDTRCQYRIYNTHGEYLYPTVSPNVLSVMEDGNWADTIAQPIHIEVFASAQQSVGGKTNLKQMYPDGSTAYPHGNVSYIEKFCLPSYNPNNY